MHSHKLVLKFFAEDAPGLEESAFVPVFHSFIQSHALPGHLLIDVADYQHVPDGPGTVLVSHEANYYLDHSVGKRPGLMYQRKQPIAGARTFRERLTAVFAAALHACARLEGHPALSGSLRFRPGDAVLRINDRLLAPNTHETYEGIAPELREFLAGLYPGSDVALDYRPASSLSLFEVSIKSNLPPGVTALLDRLAATAPSR